MGDEYEAWEMSKTERHDGDEEGRLGNLGDDATAMRREEEGMGDE